ncbi:uncharacterized protein SCHCODRAFT_02639905 [Schizophyllum commune H4-8]|uniref:uncharacterized protein n=1 Tax=Schizophyllum commune (strain H4-8 / FGSC 9210) TaxID=578458 RepID=UPI00215EEA2C|nr:uncharacterized protein SCHCODRAFT_02639905 [Schizophyllum commune H4-8]KAI5886819.1 hypothetical protein SCHCODRAFT_02639905 [Schizophyllum commune H4-8]
MQSYEMRAFLHTISARVPSARPARLQPVAPAFGLSLRPLSSSLPPACSSSWCLQLIVAPFLPILQRPHHRVAPALSPSSLADTRSRSQTHAPFAGQHAPLLGRRERAPPSPRAYPHSPRACPPSPLSLPSPSSLLSPPFPPPFPRLPSLPPSPSSSFAPSLPPSLPPSGRSPPL